jgi:acetyl-CoA C-acetyltransferase
MGDTSIMIAGGMESMSSSRHAVHMRPGVKFGDVSMDDTLLKVLQLHYVLILLLASMK